MSQQKSKLYFLCILLVGILTLIFFIFKPFLYTLILAIIFATVFEPVHKRVLVISGGRKGVAALLSSVSIFIIIITPIMFLGVQISQETTELYASLVENGGASNFSGELEDVLNNFKKLSPVPIEFSLDINYYVKGGLTWLLQHTGFLFANIAKVIGGVFIFLIALYYLFKDGQKFKAAIVSVSPLEDMYDETILNKLALAVNSVIRGNLTVALFQGVLTAVGLAIFGVPNATLLGSIATITALIPGIGTTLILLPAIFYLYFTGEILLAGGLFIWGITAVGLIDNFLGPKLVSQGIQIHPFLILLSTLGGISFWGPLGFLFGPLVLSLLFAIFDTYATIYNREREVLGPIYK